MNMVGTENVSLKKGLLTDNHKKGKTWLSRAENDKKCAQTNMYTSISQIVKHWTMTNWFWHSTESSSDNEGNTGYIFIYTENIHHILVRLSLGIATSFQMAWFWGGDMENTRFCVPIFDNLRRKSRWECVIFFYHSKTVKSFQNVSERNDATNLPVRRAPTEKTPPNLAIVHAYLLEKIN